MIRILLAAVLLVPGLYGAVVGVDVAARSEVLAGKAFGEVGAYERIVGKARFALDPEAPANSIINDLEFAPRNEAGLVEASADIYILRPRDASKGNGAILFQVLNRGGKGLLGQFNYGGGGDGADAYGDGFLMRRGYTLVWVGWQFDLIEDDGKMRLFAPAAEGLTGWVRSAFRSTSPASKFSVAGGGHIAYPAIDPADPSYRLIERELSDGPGKTLPRDRWSFSDPTTVTLQGGFTPGNSYEVVYRSKDPSIAGLGPAAIRDFISYLRYSDSEVGGDRKYDRAIAFGSSQSGRFLRTFLYDGFNADEQGRQVFDGVWPHIAGAARGSFTHRFAQPTRTDPFYTTDVFPFRDAVDRDPVTGAEDGILARSAEAGVVPKIFYTNTSNEYWGRSASLIHTTIDGERDAPIAENTRIYHFTGTQHGAGSTPPAIRPNFHYAINGNDYRPMMRALLDAFDAWIRDGRRPPASRYPSVEHLTTLEELGLPAFEGARSPKRLRRAMRLDYGPEFRSKGIAAFEPPRVVGPPYAAKVPKLDADGNEIGGIRLPSVEVPLATYAGWNLNNRSVIDSPEIAGNTGSTMPFLRTHAARLRAGDERPAVLERYESRWKYLERIREEAAELRRERYLIEEDEDRIVGYAARMWDYLAGDKGIRLWSKDARYWQYNGEPVVLMGGSDDDNLFQWPDDKLREQLDAMQAVGANYVRNTMSDRHDLGFELYPYQQLPDGRYDLGQWNEEYWKRFERFLDWTEEQDVIVQIELWDRFDHSRGYWTPHPYNPKNNVNYTFEESGFSAEYPLHPVKNKQPFYFTTPAQRNNELVLKYQRRFIDKMLSYSLRHGNVLYCMDNETSGEPEWSEYWARHVKSRAREAGVDVFVTEMWDDWNIRAPRHRRTWGRPELYDFVDVSQNNHNYDRDHWENALWVRELIEGEPRPINTVKTYGADGNDFGHSDDDGVERFWRHLLAGFAAARFHRPDSGLGINEKAQAAIRAARLLETFVPLWDLKPSESLLDREEAEAYLAAASEKAYVVYLPAGGSVKVEVPGGEYAMRWIDVGTGTAGSKSKLNAAGATELAAPGKGHWVGVLTR